MSKNIAILTFHRALNYGAILQSYALMTVIQQFAGVEVKIIDYNAEKFKLQYINPKNISALPSLKRKIKRIIRWIVRYDSTKKESKKFKFGAVRGMIGRKGEAYRSATSGSHCIFA